MDGLHSLARIAVVMALLYVAAVVELMVPAQEFLPSAIALAVTAAACVTHRSAIVWAAIGGGLIDITSAGRLGPHLIAYGILAAVFLNPGTPHQRSWWFVPTLSFLLAAVRPLIVLGIAMSANSTNINATQSGLAALTQGSATACTAGVGLLLLIMIQRVWQPNLTHQPLALTNRWDMITN